MVISTFLAALIMITAVFGVCTLIAVGLEAILGLVWKRIYSREAPVDSLVILAYLAALLIAIWGIWTVQQVQVLYANFGSDLPWPTLLVMQYRYLLVLPLAALALLHFRLRAMQGGMRLYVLPILFGEFILLVLVETAIYLPVFSFSEAVQE